MSTSHFWVNCLFNTSLFLFLILTCFLSEITSHLIASISFSAPPSWYLCSVVFRAMGKKHPHSDDFSMTRNSICNLCGSTALKQQRPSCTNMPLCLTRRGPMETPTLLKAIDFKHGQPSLPAYHSNSESTTLFQTQTLSNLRESAENQISFLYQSRRDWWKSVFGNDRLEACVINSVGRADKI